MKGDPGIGKDIIETNLTKEERNELFSMLKINSKISLALEKGKFISFDKNKGVFILIKKSKEKDFAGRNTYKILIIVCSDKCNVYNLRKMLEKYDFSEFIDDVEKEIRNTNYKMLLFIVFLISIIVLGILLFYYFNEGGNNAS